MQKRMLIRIMLFSSFLLLVIPLTIFGLQQRHNAHATPAEQNLVQYVDPFVGTAPSTAPLTGTTWLGTSGVTFPGAVAPFGMAQVSPDTSGDIGYTYGNGQIQDFSMTHFSGAGCGNNQDIPFAPTVGANNTTTAVTFSHSNESASPGYYSVKRDDGVTTELTATQRTAFARFTFPATTNANVMFDPGQAANGASNISVQVSGSREVRGQATSGNFCGNNNSYTIYFDAQFDHDFTVSQGPGNNALVTFDTTSNSVVQMKVGISYVSIDNASGNIAAENPNWDFNSIRSSTSEAWNQLLNKLQVSGGSNENLTKFYTALYHSLIHPNVFSDSNGQYIGFDGNVYTASGYTQYANFSLWDTYRSQSQLVALIAPNQASDMMQSLVNDAQQCGAFPRWSQNNSDTGVMIGDPGTIIVSNSYAFGATHFDTASALSFMKKSATQSDTSCNGHSSRPGLDTYQSSGYLPYNSVDGPSATTLEYASADFAAASFANALGDTATATSLATRSTNWSNLFNSSSGYIQPRNQDGSWKDSFDPAAEDSFIEGNSAQYTWMVPFDPRSLFDKLGGNSAAVARLDDFFSELNAGPDRAHAYMGNEPSFNSPWLYDWAQAPSHTQDVVRRILDQVFTTGPGGLPGNDDLGETSSWYVWGALGMYPEMPGVGGFALATPLFPTTTITLGNDNVVTLNASGAPSRYIQSLALNGNSYNSPWLPLSTISGGATLNYTLGDTASSWGSDASAAPPSFNGVAPGASSTPTPQPTATSTPTATPTPTSTPIPGNTVIAINAGGGASGSFVADTDYDQGNQYTDTSSAIDTSGVTNPAPQALYQSLRWNSAFTYTIPNLTAGASYTVRLHFAELTFQGAGQRVFNVAINGSSVLSNFDVYASAGYKHPLVKTFTVTANSSGNIVIAFTQGGADNPFVNGIEVLQQTAATPTPTSTPKPTATPTPTSTPTSGSPVIAINAGGAASGNFVADTDVNQGNQYSDTSSSINTSGVSNPALQAVYQTCRWNSSFTYTIPNLTAGKSYKVRLHWAELTFQAAGARVFNVAINGSSVLSKFDVYATAGYKKALVKEFTVTANNNGQIVIAFTQGTSDNPFINGIEVFVL